MSNSNMSGPYCECSTQRASVYCGQLVGCCCGEEENHFEWGWVAETPSERSVLVSEDARQVTFHPVYSAGTAAVRGSAPLLPNHHYYWEVKMISDVYGTDIMVGVGTLGVIASLSQHKFSSLLGSDERSYGLSYRGAVQHAGVARPAPGFTKGTLVGVAIDTWRGALEFYVNRKPIGVRFTQLRRHAGALYPMLCSTAAQSVLRLTYAGSRPASLLVHAALALAAPSHTLVCLPPGLPALLRALRWTPFPHERLKSDSGERSQHVAAAVTLGAATSARVGGEFVLPAHFISGYYADGVEREFRVVVRE